MVSAKQPTKMSPLRQTQMNFKSEEREDCEWKERAKVSAEIIIAAHQLMSGCLMQNKAG